MENYKGSDKFVNNLSLFSGDKKSQAAEKLNGLSFLADNSKIKNDSKLDD